MNNDYSKYLSYLGGLRFWIISACVIIVVAGIKESSFLINIILLATFITSISLAPLYWLRKKGVPETLAIIIVILGIVIIASSTLVVIGSSAGNFIDKLPFYEQKFTSLWRSTHELLTNYGVIDDEFTPMEELNPANIFAMLGAAFAGFGNVFTASLLILIVFIFMIFEARTFGRKMKLISPESLEYSDNIISKLRKYFGIKFLTSLATGICITIGLLILGIDFPVLWGFLAFVLNFIPSVGSFIAAIPAVLLAFIQLSPLGALFTAIMYFVINTLVGNVIEPQLMGKNLGISPLIVFLAMLFWGFILGPIGMLIATPLMIIIKIIFDSRPVTRNMGILISDEKEIKALEEEKRLHLIYIFLEDIIGYIIIFLAGLGVLYIYQSRRNHNRQIPLSQVTYPDCILKIMVVKQGRNIQTIIFRIIARKNFMVNQIVLELIDKDREFSHLQFNNNTEGKEFPTEIPKNKYLDTLIPFEEFKSELEKLEKVHQTFRFVVENNAGKKFKTNELSFNKNWNIYRPDSGKYN